MAQCRVGHLAGGKGVQQSANKRGEGGQPLGETRATRFVLRHELQKVARQQERTVAAQQKGGEKHKIAGCHQPHDRLQRHGQETVQEGQRVKGQVDAEGVKQIITVKGVGAQLEKSMLDPPQIPSQWWIIDAVARHVRAEMGCQRPGKQ